MNNQLIQKAELAGKTKLTAVTIGYGGFKYQFFAMLKHDSKGRAVLPAETLYKILSQRGVRRGENYSVA